MSFRISRFECWSVENGDNSSTDNQTNLLRELWEGRCSRILGLLYLILVHPPQGLVRSMLISLLHWICRLAVLRSELFCTQIRNGERQLANETMQIRNTWREAAWTCLCLRMEIPLSYQAFYPEEEVFTRHHINSRENWINSKLAHCIQHVVGPLKVYHRLKYHPSCFTFNNSYISTHGSDSKLYTRPPPAS